MGFNIKNNYGPNIEVNAGGKVMLTQDRSGLWHTVDAEEAEYEEVTTPQVPQQVVPVAKKDYGTPQTEADFKAVFDKEMKEKEVLKETAQQEYKTWTNTECFGAPTLEKLEQYRLRILLELFASGIFDSLVSKMVATEKKEGEINFDVLDEEAECRKAWRNYAALRNFFEYETGVLKVGNTSRLGRLFFTLVDDSRADEKICALFLFIYRLALIQKRIQELFLHFYEMQYNRFCEQWYSYRSRIVEILKEDLSNRRKCNKFYALKDEVWKNLYESKFLDALKDGINIYDIDDYRKEHPGTDKSEDEIREVLALAEMVDDDNNPYKEKIGKYIFEHRKTLSFEDISSFFVYLDAIPFILKNIEKLREENCDETVAPQLSANDSTSEVEQDNPSCPLNSISPFTPAVIDTTKADVVIALLRQLMEGKTKPKDVLMPVRAAMDAGVIRRPTWEEFCQEFGLWRVKNKSSFSDYTNPDNQPYIGVDFELIKDKFR